ncbi:class I SAM-dependent methyltransferase [Desmonostoc muscorum LEGE 12446]|uniref:Class I SAM-dependent methyltransferase n=1 Tax=Desmonostoc muscorum LEGE 12446 TaxID=1828758 RepID=A0A8J7A799_DESMC|nr:class I SAM-dependent methyltransferase [Desmonostoc muscorum]MCF2149122.1 class I SAM-dependent methyltransferase [Desmonostoc muscorum LEGE 12446]
MSTSTISVSNHSITKYIHGYTKDEQDRLIRQSNFLEPYIYSNVDFSNCHHIIEVGCGVGAQIEALLKRWPDLKITGVDISQAQISRASEFLKPYIEAGRVSLHVSHGGELPLPDESFDGALICFVLEHAHNPLNVLKEIKRVMKSGSSLYCTEAFNAGVYTYPTCLAFQTYWEIFNRYQKELNGDPDAGIKLYNLALKAGFSEVTSAYIPIYLDDRMKDISRRINLIDWFVEAILSVAPILIAQDRVTPYLVEEMTQELSWLKHNQDTVFIYPFQQIKAVK